MLLIALVLFVTAAMYAQPGSDQPTNARPSDGQPGKGKQQMPQARGCDAVRPMAVTAVGSHLNITPVIGRSDEHASAHNDASGDSKSVRAGASENDETSLIDANTGGSPQNSPAQ